MMSQNGFDSKESMGGLQKGKPQARIWVVLLIFVLVILNMVVSLPYIGQLDDGSEAYRYGQIFGHFVTPIIFGFIVVGLFQFGKQFRNPRSRWNIFAWVMFINLLFSLQRLVLDVVNVET